VSESRRSRWGPASSEAARLRLTAQPSYDTGPEMRLRTALHRMGLRYRVHERPIPSFRRQADIVFRSARVAVFVDGCFWHGCPTHGTCPKSNAEQWLTKIQGNRRRDRNTDKVLQDAGWKVIRIWEHEELTEAISAVLGGLERSG
jgi:DNA mismatch endonuclease (patch repair protein)